MSKSLPSPSEEPRLPVWDAATYHKVASPQAGWGERLAGEFKWRGDETVLDAGCGAGGLTLKLLEFIPKGRIFAVDGDREMVMKARETLDSPAREGRVTLFCRELLGYFPPVEADVVFSNAVFHWITDHERLWPVCFSWLVPGGWLWAQCGGQGNIMPQIRIAREVGSKPPFKALLGNEMNRRTKFAGESDTREILKRAGFEEIRVWLEPAPTEFDSTEGFTTFVRTVILRPYLARLPGELKEEFVQAWVKRHLAVVGRRLDYIRLNVRARRPASGS